ncbi:MAG: hypothetical protein ACFFAE_19545, partial [Candidatus Hodarchaeota archaeon]
MNEVIGTLITLNSVLVSSLFKYRTQIALSFIFLIFSICISLLGSSIEMFSLKKGLRLYKSDSPTQQLNDWPPP